MESLLLTNRSTVAEIGSIYKRTIEDIDNITSQYLKEVKLGADEKQFLKWNKYIINHLGIDNVTLFKKGDKEE
jgi:hypothetical protein